MRGSRFSFVARPMVGVLLLLLVLVLSVRGQQFFFRYRAERLKNEWQNLSYGVNYENARGTLERWGPIYDHGSAWCREAACTAEIALSDFAYAHGAFFFRHERLLRTYELLGGRPVMVTARVFFSKNELSGKSFETRVEVNPFEMAPPSPFGYTLIGVSTVSMDISGRHRVNPRHPTYDISWPSGCEICIMISADIRPSASKQDMERVSGFNFSCLTRWLDPCREKGDIMPAAFAQTQVDERPLP